MSRTDSGDGPGARRLRGVVDISFQSVGVAGSDQWPGVHSLTINGFLDETWHGVLVHTGIENGLVEVVVEARSVPPDGVDDGDWDEIAEASVEVATGEQLRVVLLGEDPPQLPPLSSVGPGSYRLRAHGRGRDRHPQESWDGDPVETYLFQAWPAPPAPLEVIRHRDVYGAEMRAAAAGRVWQPPRPWDDSDDIGTLEDDDYLTNPYCRPRRRRDSSVGHHPRVVPHRRRGGASAAEKRSVTVSTTSSSGRTCPARPTRVARPASSWATRDWSAVAEAEGQVAGRPRRGPAGKQRREGGFADGSVLDDGLDLADP